MGVYACVHMCVYWCVCVCWCVCVHACVCVCVLGRKGAGCLKAYSCSSSMDGCVSDQSQWLSDLVVWWLCIWPVTVITWPVSMNNFCTPYTNKCHWFEKCPVQSLILTTIWTIVPILAAAVDSNLQQWKCCIKTMLMNYRKQLFYILTAFWKCRIITNWGSS